MSRDRREGRRAGRRAFRPGLDGQRLEPRLLLSSTKHAPYSENQYILTHPQSAVAKKLNRPAMYKGSKAIIPVGPTYDKGVVVTQTAHGGSQVLIATPDGSHFRVSVTYADNLVPPQLATETGNTTATGVQTTNSVSTATFPTSTVPQPTATVRAYAMPGGKVGLIVSGSTDQMQLEIDPLAFPQRKGYAESFAYGQSGRSDILNIGSIDIVSGSIQAILGYHDADLSGPLTIGGDGTVDRIAFADLLPGAAIGVGGTLNTLDILNNVDLTSGPGISIGRDLNLFNAGGNVTLANGASIQVGRFVGLQPQPPKGTSTGSNILTLNQSLLGTGTSEVIPSVSGYIQGSFTIGPGSTFSVASGIANSSITSITGVATGGSPSPFLIDGTLAIYSRSQIQIPNVQAGTTFLTTTSTGTVQNNLVARNGIVVATGS